jgi:hypothetical protein
VGTRWRWRGGARLAFFVERRRSTGAAPPPATCRPPVGDGGPVRSTGMRCLRAEAMKRPDLDQTGWIYSLWALMPSWVLWPNWPPTGLWKKRTTTDGMWANEAGNTSASEKANRRTNVDAPAASNRGPPLLPSLISLATSFAGFGGQKMASSPLTARSKELDRDRTCTYEGPPTGRGTKRGHRGRLHGPQARR